MWWRENRLEIYNKIEWHDWTCQPDEGFLWPFNWPRTLQSKHFADSMMIQSFLSTVDIFSRLAAGRFSGSTSNFESYSASADNEIANTDMHANSLEEWNRKQWMNNEYNYHGLATKHTYYPYASWMGIRKKKSYMKYSTNNEST